MLKIHKPNNTYGKLLALGITSICGIGVLLGLSALTYTPELSHAEKVTYIPETHPNLSDIAYMQDITQEICTNTREADTEGNYQYQLRDSRDQKTYLVAKLKDGNCWMTQNLNIVNKTISSADSNMSSGSFTIPASNKTGFTSDDVTKPKAYSDTTYGGYYNWYTATAGSGPATGTAGWSICPKGWKLPTKGNSTGQYHILLDGLTQEQAINAPYNFKQGGGIYDGKMFDNNNQGIYWSSTPASSIDYAHAQFFIPGLTAEPAISNSTPWRYFGFSVRCLTPGSKTNNDNIEITINPTISIDVVSEVEVEKGESNPSTANFDVKVASNQGYKVQINSTNPNLTSATNSTTIPSRAGTLNTNVNGWGIKLITTSTYSQITSTPTTFYTASGAEVKTVPFIIGISTSPDLPNGEYSTDITITATQN